MLQAPAVDRDLPAIEVRGETSCPRAEDVAAALARMLGPASPDAPGDIAELSERDGWFVITLRRPSGETLGEKRLPTTLGCQVRAEAAAVSIAALEAQLGGAGALPLPTPPAEEQPPTAEPPPIAAAVPQVVETVKKQRPPAASVSLATEVGASVLASLNGTDLAPAARLEVALRHQGGSWAFVLAGLAVGAHRIAVPPGDASWSRVGGEVGLRVESPLGRAVRLQQGVGLAVTALAVEGHGFSRTASDTLLDPGPVARIRILPAAGHFRPWLEVSGVYWFRAHRLTVLGGPTTEVPDLELFVGLGASFGGPR